MGVRTGEALCGGAVPGDGKLLVVGVGAAAAEPGPWAGDASGLGCGYSGGGAFLGAMGGAALTGGAAAGAFHGMWAWGCGGVWGMRWSSCGLYAVGTACGSGALGGCVTSAAGGGVRGAVFQRMSAGAGGAW